MAGVPEIESVPEINAFLSAYLKTTWGSRPGLALSKRIRLLGQVLTRNFRNALLRIDPVG
jgi:hypothetical protein